MAHISWAVHCPVPTSRFWYSHSVQIVCAFCLLSYMPLSRSGSSSLSGRESGGISRCLPGPAHCPSLHLLGSCLSEMHPGPGLRVVGGDPVSKKRKLISSDGKCRIIMGEIALCCSLISLVLRPGLAATGSFSVLLICSRTSTNETSTVPVSFVFL